MTLSSEPPLLISAPESLTKECEKPVSLPERTLTQFEVETLWIEDRSSLLKCGSEKKALFEYYRSRDLKIGRKND